MKVTSVVIFDKLDEDEDGLVSLDELKGLIKLELALGLDELQSLVGKNEALTSDFILLRGHAFKVFDLNGDGFISCEELQKVLSRLGLWDENEGSDCKNMIHMYDTNLDGVLDFEEFKSMMLVSNSRYS
ncbi:hypothetical protein HAX54_048046 [Datura stramonium]|uniref:EF-hand domain-containing protein n=1 Tax=Datura stramonium TaxID=4076 RepID=A0ABS8WMP6_DATST|nr:hypothetical protein [Datura stramonium]